MNSCKFLCRNQIVCVFNIDFYSFYFLLLNAAGTSELSSSEGESSGSRATGSTHFSQRNNPTVLRDSKKAAMVDLSSMRKKYKGI